MTGAVRAIGSIDNDTSLYVLTYVDEDANGKQVSAMRSITIT